MEKKDDIILEQAITDKDIDVIKKMYEQRHDNNSKLGFSYGKLLYDGGELVEARQVLKKVITQKSTNIYIINSYLILGKIEADCGNYQLAKEYLNKVISMGKSTSNAILELARVFYQESDIEQARFYLKEAIRMNNPYAYNLLAMLEFKEGNDKKSISIINDALNHGYCNKLGVDYILIEYFIKKYNIFFNNEFINEYIDLDKLVDYNKDDAIDHILQRHVYNKEGKYNFYYDVDVENLMELAKENMNKATKHNVLVFYDYYVIPNKNLGIDDDYYLKVVALPHTKDIITMYPVKNKFETDILGNEVQSDIRTKK